MFKKLCFLTLLVGCLAAQLRNSTAKSVLRGANVNASSAAGGEVVPCTCVPNSPYWKATPRAVPKCVFIDLGAADGNSFTQFLAGGYGPIANCPSGQWEALLVEANPQFTPALNAVASQYPGAVHAYGSTAAYMCQGTTSFSIDPDAANNHWGSSMKKNHGSTQVTVPTLNVVQLIAENTVPGDWVMLKVDIEGAEYDLIPCLAQFQQVNLLDIIFLEEHHWFKTDAAYTDAEYAAAKMHIKAAGVSMPDNYHSGTLLQKK